MAYSPYTGSIPSRQTPLTFSDDMDSWLTWFTPNADEVVAKSTAAVAAAAGSELAKWVSGASYSEGDGVYSPVDYQSYRAKTTHSGETTDPSSDTTNWALFSVGADPIFDSIDLNGEFVEKVYTITGTSAALDPANGTIQVQTFTGNTTHTDSLADGESILLMIDDGTGYTWTPPTLTWLNVSGSQPSLASSGYNVFVIFKVGGTLYAVDVLAG